MPHTRGNAIVLSESWVSNFTNNKNIDRFITLISHEQFHIIQRYNPEKFEIIYTKYWNMKKINKLPEELIKINRANPDALPNNLWVFHIDKNNYILPLCIYNTKNENDNIRNTKNVYFNLVEENNSFRF